MKKTEQEKNIIYSRYSGNMMLNVNLSGNTDLSTSNEIYLLRAHNANTRTHTPVEEEIRLEPTVIISVQHFNSNSLIFLEIGFFLEDTSVCYI